MTQTFAPKQTADPLVSLILKGNSQPSMLQLKKLFRLGLMQGDEKLSLLTVQLFCFQRSALDTNAPTPLLHFSQAVLPAGVF